MAEKSTPPETAVAEEGGPPGVATGRGEGNSGLAFDVALEPRESTDG